MSELSYDVVIGGEEVTVLSKFTDGHHRIGIYDKSGNLLSRKHKFAEVTS